MAIPRSRSIFLATSVTLVILGAAASAGGCGDDGNNSPSAADSGSPDDGSQAANGDGSPTDSGTPDADAKPCTNLCLQQKTCAEPGKTTSLSGIVRDPAGKVPLYNAIVYVPNAAVPVLTTGVIGPGGCDRCAASSTTLLGDPVTSTLTGTDGKFVLPNVPVGTKIPLVVQIGKWRRQYTVPTVAECTDTPVDPDKTRLPVSRVEGELPQIALTTGGADVMECFLRKVGIDDSEVTANTGTGRVHLYAGSGATVVTKFAATHESGADFGSATDLWSAAGNLGKYDILIMSCEGGLFSDTKLQPALDAMKAYTTAGGRVIATHFHRYWFDTTGGQGPAATSPFENFATWTDRTDPPSPSFATINTTFPKGVALKSWLADPGVAATDAGAPLEVLDGRRNVDAVSQKAVSWMTLPPGAGADPTTITAMTARTPIAAPDNQKCGRIVYSDLHASATDQRAPWPDGCITTDLTPQEKALEFLMFDMSGCLE